MKHQIQNIRNPWLRRSTVVVTLLAYALLCGLAMPLVWVAAIIATAVRTPCQYVAIVAGNKKLLLAITRAWAGRDPKRHSQAASRILNSKADWVLLGERYGFAVVNRREFEHRCIEERNELLDNLEGRAA